MNLTDLRKLVSKLNKEDKILGVWKMKRPEIETELTKVKYVIDDENKQLKPTIEMKRKRIIKLTESKTDVKHVTKPKKKKEESNFDVKNLSYDSDDEEYIYKDKFIKKIGLNVENSDALLTEFYKNPNEQSPKKYVAKVFKEMLTHLVSEKKLSNSTTIKLNSPFKNEFDETNKDPKKLLNYYKSLGFKLKGKYEMKNDEDQFVMIAKIT